MPRYFLQIAYDGTEWHGWQMQPNAPTVQAEIARVLSLLLRHEVMPIGCGRTDTGVHARDFYLHFDSDNPLCLQRQYIVHRLNRMLPRSIVAFRIIPVADDANSRFDAIARTYTYYCITAKDPFMQGYAWHLPLCPDFELMNLAAEKLLNFTDFTSFSKLHTQTATNNCRISNARWTTDNHHLNFTISADRFLRNMVRAIVGTLLEVGFHKIDLEGFSRFIEGKDRQLAGMSVPACGLFLEKVTYPKGIFVSQSTKLPI
ncbi:MAG: tRNA pseudouridine(38-40) synthase TruA [Bacteroidetes bacterium HGW-Bacteroidetes-22]|nr:MAG: tRNA pseudouridine(38-40) synthase TruA [Bacteroidetes bacterium HGW-Bacteroidetes-22]